MISTLQKPIIQSATTVASDRIEVAAIPVLISFLAVIDYCPSLWLCAHADFGGDLNGTTLDCFIILLSTLIQSCRSCRVLFAPAKTPTFSVNGTNAAKTVTARFYR